MKSADEQYLSLLGRILEDGETHAPSRTGLGMKSLKLESMKYDLREGFPIITSRKIPYKSAMVELEGFIKGITDKRWYEERGCRFWSYWCDPREVPYATDADTKAKMKAEPELGLIYGSQWRNFHDPHATTFESDFGGHCEVSCISEGVDQLQILVDKIRSKKYDRRWKVSAWNPLAFDCMALVPCHTDFTVTMSGDETYMDLEFNMRSNDLPLGNPNNVIFYAALLHLLSNEGGCIPRYLKINMSDVHVYEDQIEIAKEHMQREVKANKAEFKLLDWKFDDIFNWTHECFELKGYEHSGVLKYPIPAI